MCWPMPTSCTASSPAREGGRGETQPSERDTTTAGPVQDPLPTRRSHDPKVGASTSWMRNLIFRLQVVS
jgi:hypothetical protein